LSAMESPETVAARRGKKVEEISWVQIKQSVLN
jgi:hypothetical protein